MDTSETYIKMSEKAEEIQKLWMPQEGDWFWVRGRNAKGELETMCLSSLAISSDHDTIYIPVLEELHAHFALEDELPKEMPIDINKQTYTRFPLRYFVWLPRQDDLQKMIEYEWTGDLIRRFHIWGKRVGYQTQAIASMEQLWLAFVMKEKYNKVWANNEWRNGSEST